MQFTTKVPIERSSHPIDYNSKIMAMGSCFAQNMGEKFDYFKFQNTVNPFGIIFNPGSIERLVSRAVNQIKFTEEELFFHNERWHCYEVHSELSHPDKVVLLENLNNLLQSATKQISESTHVVITYGTAWAYRLKTSSKIVANCHKVPQNQFEKELLTVETIEKSVQNTIGNIRKVNPQCNITFTISPVRHIKDGFTENQRSKSNLIIAVHNQLSGCSYFPSYEIMMDELRDYRFYAEDMLHPNVVAIDYIWELFFLSHMEEPTIAVMQEVGAIQRSLQHKPFYPDSENHQQFLLALNQKIATLVEQFPQIQF